MCHRKYCNTLVHRSGPLLSFRQIGVKNYFDWQILIGRAHTNATGMSIQRPSQFSPRREAKTSKVNIGM